MKPYGLPRTDDVRHPDVADIRAYALASRAGSVPGKGGECRSLVRAGAKARTRRYFKRKARSAAKAQIQMDIAR